MMFFDVIIIVFVLSLSLYLGIYIFQRKRNQRIRNEVLSLLNSKGLVSTDHGRQFFKINDKTYELLFFYVPSFAELTINSKIIWEIKDSSKSRLFNQSHFLSSPFEKLIIVFPSQVAIKRFINENELVFVKYNEPFNNIYVVRTNELNNLLHEDIL
jgi:hypothetical protein